MRVGWGDLEKGDSRNLAGVGDVAVRDGMRGSFGDFIGR